MSDDFLATATQRGSSIKTQNELITRVLYSCFGDHGLFLIIGIMDWISVTAQKLRHYSRGQIREKEMST
jgi:hypothetical protein